MFKEIHNNIYKSLEKEFLDVFLCGGASNKNHISIRDQVRTILDKSKHLRILYPEDLFIEILGKNKTSDLLSLENFLAENSDYICIICESAGSLVELGAFTNHSEIIKKLIVVIDEKRKKDKSFIMLGPIKLIQKKISRKHVIFNEENKTNELATKLEKLFLHNISKIEKKKPISSLIGLYYFIPLILFFFGSLKVDELEKYIELLFKELSYDVANLETIYKSAIKLNFKEKNIKKNINIKDTTYELTNAGYENVNKSLAKLNIFDKSKEYDRIRFKILKNKLY